MLTRSCRLPEIGYINCNVVDAPVAGNVTQQPYVTKQTAVLNQQIIIKERVERTLILNLIHIARKPVFRFPTSSETNWP